MSCSTKSLSFLAFPSNDRGDHKNVNVSCGGYTVTSPLIDISMNYKRSFVL